MLTNNDTLSWTWSNKSLMRDDIVYMRIRERLNLIMTVLSETVNKINLKIKNKASQTQLQEV